MSSAYAANRVRSKQARATARRSLKAVPGIHLIEHPDDPGLLITVGRGGVVLVEGRAWSGDVALDGGRLLVSGRDRSDVLARLSERLDAVRRQVTGIEVRGALTLDRPDGPRLIAGDIVVVTVDDLRRSLAARPPLLSDAQVADARAALTDGAGAPPAQDHDLPSNIDRWVQVVYLRDAGGRIMGRLGGLYKVTLIGHRWRKGRTDRLYGTFATPTEGVVQLGHVDLVTGELHPSGGEPVAKDRRAPADYLRRLHRDLPTL